MADLTSVALGAREPPLVSLYVTAPDDGHTAEALARALLERQLAACVNLVPGVVSLYRWQGELQRDEEVLLVAKTRASLVRRASDLLCMLHPYDLPCVTALPLVGGAPDYLAWVVAQTRCELP